MKTRYWINTRGNYLVLFNAVNHVPSLPLSLMHDLVECSKFEYFLFKTFRFNNKAKDKWKWIRQHIGRRFHGKEK